MQGYLKIPPWVEVSQSGHKFLTERHPGQQHYVWEDLTQDYTKWCPSYITDTYESLQLLFSQDLVILCIIQNLSQVVFME